MDGILLVMIDEKECDAVEDVITKVFIVWATRDFVRRYSYFTLRGG